MKTLITVSWSRTVEIEIDDCDLSLIRQGHNETIEKYQSEACDVAGSELNWKELVVTDCEDFPDLIE
jgi:hypothetical protein